MNLFLDFIDKPINPPAPYKFSVVSAFAGCGGSSLGYKWAGGHVLAAIEWNARSAEAYRYNHADTPLLERDIATVAVEEMLTLCQLRPGELDILDGSPPCQGFSTIGKRQFADSRNDLFREYVRLLQGLQPKALVMENVSGLVQGKMKLIFADILRELKDSGYQVRAWRLNVMYFGVPQARERVIFIGARHDLKREPTCPPAQTRPITSRQALIDCRVDEEERQMLLEAGRKYAAYREWHLIPPGGKKIDVVAEGGGFSCKKLHPDKPSHTLIANDSKINLHGIMHWEEKRRLALAECKRLASFPDAFVFPGGWEQGVACIGNSVPPRFMQAIAEHIYNTILQYGPSS